MAQRVGHAQKSHKPATSWRDVIKVHSAADLFPLMPEAELRELGEDIKKNGLTSPIVFFKEGTSYSLLDGRNRLDAMELVGISFSLRDHGTAGWKISQPLGAGFLPSCPQPVVVFQKDPHDFVLSANIHRRHLTTEQKRELIAKVLKAKPDRSNLHVAKTVGVSHPTVAKVRTRLEDKGDIEKVSTSTDTKGRKSPIRKSRPAKSESDDASLRRRNVSWTSTTSAVEIAVRLLIDLLAQGTKANVAQTAMLLHKKLDPGSCDRLFKWLDHVKTIVNDECA
jgi:hypothetical protein